MQINVSSFLNNNLFLYTDIEKEDEGYIMVDFFKVKGEIYGKIIEKNKTIITDEVNWESIDGKIISNLIIIQKNYFLIKKIH